MVECFDGETDEALPEVEWDDGETLVVLLLADLVVVTMVVVDPYPGFEPVETGVVAECGEAVVFVTLLVADSLWLTLTDPRPEVDCLETLSVVECLDGETLVVRPAVVDAERDVEPVVDFLGIEVVATLPVVAADPLVWLDVLDP